MANLPKKFRDICELLRDGKPEGLAQLEAYSGLEQQKSAVLAEVSYFDGDFERALNLDKEIYQCWDEWYYSNCKNEHLLAMIFAARQTGREKDLTDFISNQVTPGEDSGRFERLRDGVITRLEADFVDKSDIYKAPEAPLTIEEVKARVLANKSKKGKIYDLESPDGLKSIFYTAYTCGSLEDALPYYELIKDNNVASTMDHVNALSAYNHTGDTEKAFGTVLRMAAQRLWFVASHTQVRPMEFFLHPGIYQFLGDKSYLHRIVEASCRSQQ